eukprot:COSAG06_NODE_40164_length_404_cov_2.081967_1_plen_59_part_10
MRGHNEAQLRRHYYHFYLQIVLFPRRRERQRRCCVLDARLPQLLLRRVSETTAKRRVLR